MMQRGKEQKKKRLVVKAGDIFKITLEDGEYCYCMQLIKGTAFFDYKGRDELSTEEIVKLPILFIIGVDKYAFKDGGWEKVGKDKEFEASLHPLPNKFIWDMIGKRFELYITETGEIKPATFEEIKGLERASSWANHHIEDRLRDHYLGVECKWLKDTKRILDEMSP